MVKVTPAHDANDFEIASRAGLPQLNVMTPEARMSDAVPEAFRGMGPVRGQKGGGRCARVPKGCWLVPRPHPRGAALLPVPDRGGATLSKQWFVKMKPLAEPALAASGTAPSRSPRSVGRRSTNTGSRTSATGASRVSSGGGTGSGWYCTGCEETIVAREDPTACPKCGSDDLAQDPDVLDTWFSSWLWPFSTFRLARPDR